MQPAYDYHRLSLQVLQSRAPGRWSLKAPGHLLALDALLATYPDARVVVLHRDPMRTVPSSASLSVTSRPDSLSTADFDGYFGPMWVDVLGTMVDRLVEHRDRNGDDGFVDIHYRDFVADPVATVARIYAHFGETLSPTARPARCAQHLASHPQGKHGAHAYTLADFGLDEPAVRDRFAAYTERFGIEEEGMSDLRLAFVGCGAIAEWHLHAIKHGGTRIEVVAVIDPDPARARAIADQAGARVFGSLADGGARGRVRRGRRDGPAPPPRAGRDRGVRAGLHVLLEKPMAPTLDACDRILAAAASAGTTFMVAENAQYWPEVVLAKQLIEDGTLGEIITARACSFVPPLDEFFGGEKPWRFDAAAAGGGVAIDAGSHWIRPLRMWLGEIREVVAALGHPFPGMEGESLCRSLCRFDERDGRGRSTRCSRPARSAPSRCSASPGRRAS